MADNTLITVLRGKLRLELPYKALIGEYGDRLTKSFGGDFTITDPRLREKLTRSEYAALAAKYSYLVAADLPPEPPLLDETESLEPQPKKRGRKPKTETDAD